LLDDRALTEDQIQTFLEKTPYGTRSPLADYKDYFGNPASAILKDAAAFNNINPLELLVRLQMEKGLIGGGGKTPTGAKKDADPEAEENAVDDATQEKIDAAFGCGFINTFEIQAFCAAGSISHGMQKLKGGKSTSGGWKVKGTTTTKDKVQVTPDNAATAAIYAYTPYVGEKGGGAKGVAGVSGHMDIWNSFAKALHYKTATCPPTTASKDGGADAAASCGCTSDSDCGTATSGRVCNPQTQACESGCRKTGGNGCPGGQTCSSTDDKAGTCSGGADGGVTDGGRPAPDAAPPSDDDGAGHSTSSDNGHGSGDDGATSGDDDAGSDAGTHKSSKKKGCSAAAVGAEHESTAALGLLLGLAVLARRRKR
jgi:MYXO-CTERM domain-containing protein